MLKIKISSQFKRDLKYAIKRGNKIEKLEAIINLISNNIELPQKNNDHFLSGNYKGFRECHIEPDWLLIYRVNQNILTLYLYRTGTHSDLF